MTACGSPEYIAPEVYRRETYTPACDIWAVGIIVFIVLTGCFPFGDNDPSALYNKIQSGVYRWPARLDGLISDEAKAFVARLLRLRPAERPTAEEALADPWFRSEASSVQSTASVDSLKDLVHRERSG